MMGRTSLTNNSGILVRPEYHALFTGDVSGPSLTATYYVNSSELSLESAAFHIAATISCGLGGALSLSKRGH